MKRHLFLVLLPGFLSCANSRADDPTYGINGNKVISTVKVDQVKEVIFIDDINQEILDIQGHIDNFDVEEKQSSIDRITALQNRLAELQKMKLAYDASQSK